MDTYEALVTLGDSYADATSALPTLDSFRAQHPMRTAAVLYSRFYEHWTATGTPLRRPDEKISALQVFFNFRVAHLKRSLRHGCAGSPETRAVPTMLVTLPEVPVGKMEVHLHFWL